MISYAIQILIKLPIFNSIYEKRKRNIQLIGDVFCYNSGQVNQVNNKKLKKKQQLDGKLHESQYFVSFHKLTSIRFK